jgi:hypothetical protein
MSAESSFLSELLRTEPLGPALQVVGLVCVAIIFMLIDENRPASSLMKAVWGVAFVSMVVGMYRTHRAATALQAKRRARSPAPWDPPGAGS